MLKKSIISLILVVLLTGLTAVTLASEESKEKSGGGWLGIYLQDISPDIEEAMDLKSDQGVLVTEVMEDSPAEKAGIESKDVIVEFVGKGESGTFVKVEDSSQLKKMIRKASPGDVVKLKVSREGKEKVLTVTVGKAPEDEFYSERVIKLPRAKAKDKALDTYFFQFSSGSRIGVKVQDLTEQLGDFFGVTEGEGVLITEVEEDMPAQEAGLKAGDVIVEADGKKIEETEELIDAISDKEQGEKVSIKIIRNHQPQSFMVEVEKGKEKHSFDFDKLDNMKIFTKKLPAPEMKWYEESSSEFEEQMDQLREEMQELKQQMEDLKEKMR